MGAASAWEVAHRAAERAGVTLESLDAFDDVLDVCRVIDATWGGDAAQAHYIRAIQHAGNVLYGSRASGELVGFVLGFLGSSEGLHVHSHMLAVVPAWRSRGTGYALKLAQRAACLGMGIEGVRWTFDPLVARNARFNLCRLGVVAQRWLPEFYGEMTDEINRGDRSDRFEVRWDLLSDRVEAALRSDLKAPPLGPSLLRAQRSEAGPRPVETGNEPVPGCTIAVPSDHGAIRRADTSLGREWRDASARVFEACFARGLAATWMTEDCRYVFTEASP
jgi:predicted GNAT superfamily acetyltransferase